MNEKTERKLPTKEEWDIFIREMESVFGLSTLICDGYKVKGLRAVKSKNTLVIYVYVDSRIEGRWMVSHKVGENKALPQETIRFMRPRVRGLYKRKTRIVFEKMAGKKEAKEKGFYDKLVTYYPWWTSAAALKRHLIKHNHDIEFVRNRHEGL